MNQKKEILLQCPSCGSHDISKPQFSRQAMAISILLLGFPLVFSKKEYHCFDCGHLFKLKHILRTTT